VKGKVFVHAAEASDEVTFKSTDVTLGSIAPMDMWWNKLEVNIFLGQELFEDGGTFLVEAFLWLGAEAGLAKLCMEGSLGGKDRLGGSGLHGFCENAVAVVIALQCKQIVVAFARGGDEATSLFGVNLAGWFEDGSVTVMGAGLIEGTGAEGAVGVIGPKRWLRSTIVGACQSRILPSVPKPRVTSPHV
jgi:hypothetical protein